MPAEAIDKNNRKHRYYMSNNVALPEPGSPLEFIPVNAVMPRRQERIITCVGTMHVPSLVCVMEENYGSDKHHVSWSL